LCGISFVLAPDGRRITDKLFRLHAPIRHRGPDGECLIALTRAGSFQILTGPEDSVDGVVAGLAFRRLKILDLSEAAMQPMLSSDGRVALLFNGEIYNFRALRSELCAKGLHFQTTGDTEVILAAYQEWDTDCFSRFEGMWAILLVDLRLQRVVGSRDRFGIKPLYWSVKNATFMAASEARQILAALDAPPTANARNVALHLEGRRYPVTEESFFEGIESVPPATWFSIALDRVATPQFRPYWRLADVRANEGDRYDDGVERFSVSLREAVRSHHVADVPIGSLLSGGLDSSMITVLLSEIGREEGHRFPTFSFGFRDAYQDMSELRYVDALVAQETLLNYETSFDPAWVAQNVDAVVNAIEEPPLAFPVLAQFRIFELCRQRGMTVILDGQGADEILAGYPYHQRIRLSELILGRQPRKFLSELSAIASRNHVSTLAQGFDFYGAPVMRRFRRSPSLVDSDYNIAARRDGDLLDRSEDPSALNRRLHYDVRWGNVKLVLQYADRNAMAHSIEARVPFFDRALIELVFSMPPEFKIGHGDRKRVLRDAARRRLPRSITERADRMGFATPDAEFICGPLKQRIMDVISDRAFVKQPFLNRAVVQRETDEYVRGKTGEPRRIWRLFTLALWAQSFNAAF